MKKFIMCAQCRAEYDDPRNRRFHAQPNACPVCGPQLQLWNRAGKRVTRITHAGAEQHLDVLAAAVQAIQTGQILAVKGLGGFHLMAAANNDKAVRRLRELKHREEKPFALMFPSLEAIQALCEVSPLEERLLRSPEAPIVLLQCRRAARPTRDSGKQPHPTRPRRGRAVAPDSASDAVSALIAPGNPNLGVMLPYTPLHHLLLSLVGFAVVPMALETDVRANRDCL